MLKKWWTGNEFDALRMCRSPLIVVGDSHTLIFIDSCEV
jgi:hypothetical protein